MARVKYSSKKKPVPPKAQTPQKVAQPVVAPEEEQESDSEPGSSEVDDESYLLLPEPASATTSETANEAAPAQTAPPTGAQKPKITSKSYLFQSPPDTHSVRRCR